MDAPMVMGELCDDLATELLGFTFTFRPGSPTAEMTGPVDPEGPLVRALLRGEAELLMADADAMAAGTYRHRESGKRRVDALVLLVQRVGDAATARRPKPIAQLSGAV